LFFIAAQARTKGPTSWKPRYTALADATGRAAITTLHGARGVGKTTLAAAYAERYRGDYPASW
jgi:predicted AAA+ superfamily ATPase